MTTVIIAVVVLDVYKRQVMAITTTLFNGLGMGLSVLVILTPVSYTHLIRSGSCRRGSRRPCPPPAPEGTPSKSGRFSFSWVVQPPLTIKTSMAASSHRTKPP